MQTSSSVFSAEKLIRTVVSASAGVNPNASRLLLGFAECEEHAEPLER